MGWHAIKINQSYKFNGAKMVPLNSTNYSEGGMWINLENSI